MKTIIALFFALVLLSTFCVAKKSNDDEAAEMLLGLMIASEAANARTETFVNTVSSDYIYGEKCVNMGSSFFYGSYDDCRMQCNGYARSGFVANSEYRVNYFPRGTFSSGGCSCCGAVL